MDLAITFDVIASLHVQNSLTRKGKNGWRKTFRDGRRGTGNHSVTLEPDTYAPALVYILDILVLGDMCRRNLSSVLYIKRFWSCGPGKEHRKYIIWNGAILCHAPILPLDGFGRPPGIVSGNADRSIHEHPSMLLHANNAHYNQRCSRGGSELAHSCLHQCHVCCDQSFFNSDILNFDNVD